MKNIKINYIKNQIGKMNVFQTMENDLNKIIIKITVEDE